VTLEQRTPTPETEAELDETEVVHVDSEPVDPALEFAVSKMQQMAFTSLI